MKSKYRMGWLFVCFDLPVIEKEDLKCANNFRKDLLKLGYFTKMVKKLAPSTGQIYIFYLTDKQWSNSICIEKDDYNPSKYKKKMGENAEKQMTFW